MGLLSALGKVINEQFSFGENSVTDVETGSGRVPNFGLLGDFAKKIDQTAWRSYIEDGFVRNVRPRIREAILQQPDMTVLIKKRMFSSLAENYRLDLSSEDERLFLLASKILFKNKCRAIAAYELLSKIESVAVDTGLINTNMMPMLFSGISILDDVGLNIVDDKTRTALQTLKRVQAFSEPSSQTKWLVDEEQPYATALGEGTGVIELTLVSGVNVTTGVEFGSGKASLTIEDPYKLLVVTSDEIDAAIRETVSFRSGSFGTFIEVETRRLIEQQKQELNQSRAARGASRVRFIVSPESLISKRVRAVLEAGYLGGPNVPGGENSSPTPEINFTYNSGFVGIGSSVDLDTIATRGKQGLNSAEARLFKEIIKNTFLLLGFENTTKQDRFTFNKTRNYVRRKMRLHFSGKPIIQPMDIINVFVSSKTRVDDALIHGFDSANQSSGLNFANKLDSLVRNINTNFGDLTSFFKGEQSSVDEVEKAAIVGPEFPSWLWRLYRNDFTKQGAGTSVFVGLVAGASHSYTASDGKYILSVNCEDNAGYFNKSQINVRPSLDVFNQSLYDPLTPFNVSFDAATGTPLTDANTGFPELLPENQAILHSGAARFENGVLRGEKVDEFLYRIKDGEVTKSGFKGFRQVLSDPTGFVYRWKEGIGSLTKTESAFPETSVLQESSPLLTAEPFAGQDVMNVLSLLVTGQPYNYNTFVQAALANANSLVSHDARQNKPSAVAFIEHLTSQLVKRNVIWGNFVPFKKLILNEKADQFIRSGQASLVTYNSELNDLIETRSKLQDEVARRTREFIANPQVVSRDATGQFNASDNAAIRNQDLVLQIKELDRQIDLAKQRFDNTINQLATQKLNNRLLIIGDDISLSPGLSDSGSEVTEEQRSIDREEFRRKINFLTQRRLWKVKSNNDPNLFIVDDQYDKNFDIQAFSRALGGQMQLFASEYVTIETKIKEVAGLLGLEIFADTQGHIQVRPPQYNRMPSSVFYQMFKDKASTGVQVFPQFLESLFFNQLQNLINRIEIIEDEIRIRALMIGVVPQSSILPDAEISKFLRGNTTNFFDPGFVFLSDFYSGRVAGFTSLATQSHPDLTADLSTRVLSPISEKANIAAQSTRLFDAVSREDALKRTDFAAASSQTTNDRIYNISKRLERDKGVKAPDRRSLFSDDRLTRGNTNEFSTLDKLHVINDLSQFVSERQKLLPQLSNTIKNLSEGIEINDNNKGATSALFPMLNRKQGIPQILQHMIEDEDADDWGPGAGGRFIIKDSRILDLKIEETPPAHTLVEVNGLFGQGFVDSPPNLRLSDKGNAVVSAFAVDYDMWRMYGFRAPQAVPAPFFSDPDSQCAPYAVFLLNLARKDILQGTVTLVGNEYYQPGDVVYIEDRDLLFYVTSVSHNFSYGGTFTTNLVLKYGHPPGEYIPTILDIVGSQLYRSKGFATSYRSNRFGNANGDIPVGVVLFPNMSPGFLAPADSAQQQLLFGSYGESNRKALNNMLVATTGAISPIALKQTKPILELRIYFNSEISGADDALFEAVRKVRDFLINPSEFDKGGGTSIIPFSLTEGQIPQSDNIKIKVVDVSGDLATGPSSMAWHMVRTFAESNGAPTIQIVPTTSIANDAAALDNILYSHIIDAFITYETVLDTTEQTPAGASQINQAQQETQAAIDAANAKLNNSS